LIIDERKNYQSLIKAEQYFYASQVHEVIKLSWAMMATWHWKLKFSNDGLL